ncbi:rho GTPase-activating protein 26-like [Saccoglossus kowalevskii]|uniref:Rho GTPase-activating protein 26-like n=1 Tax=Saccoglossus kowalevskii TaxID=10224 RepID=A0ABM0M169_SACKO|nr:PREDICTED: rho GTPase-activating protein 26-like [Saccoglossus kowalevskii]
MQKKPPQPIRSRTTSTTSSTSQSSTPTSSISGAGMCVRTLYTCEAENDTELSFVANQIIVNVRPSKEPGWLEGTLNGKIGLVPENYVENIP